MKTPQIFELAAATGWTVEDTEAFVETILAPYREHIEMLQKMVHMYQEDNQKDYDQQDLEDQ